jgi:hypothetical protein
MSCLTVRNVLFAVALTLCHAARAHNPALDPPEPTSVPEAWNVITQCTANTQTLLDTNQLREIAYQVADCSPAVRMLQAHVSEQPKPTELAPKLEQMFNAGAAIIIAAREPNDPLSKARQRYSGFKTLVKEIAAQYPPEVVNAEVFICPMHPTDRHLKSSEVCSLCHMKLIKRRIAASSVYEAPGEPSMVMKASVDAPLRKDAPAKVTIDLSRRDGSPVVSRDLLVMHTQRIHLLIVDPTLEDYHHEHPAPTTKPGEYVFSFTPKRAGPYRIWADLVPADSCIQKYVTVDLPSDEKGGAIGDRSTVLSTEFDGIQFKLDFDTKGKSIRAREPVLGHLTVTNISDGAPVTRLEPVMGAFAHLVGFFDDYQTVIHVHPAGPEPADDHEHGGPVLPFYLYAPKPGFMKFYAQVRVDGADRFVPFSLNIAPAGAKPSK